MSFLRIASAMVCVVAGVASSPLNAQSLGTAPSTVSAPDLIASDLIPPDLIPLDLIVPDFSVASIQPVQTQSIRPTEGAKRDSSDTLFSLSNPAELDATISSAVATQVIFRAPRKRVADFAMRLRDVRYVRGGHDPVTGFDCSGFTHYVYNKTYGVNLPYDAPSQFRDGRTIPRDRMRTGDLVFFQVGKRITHVGIYLDEGRFIHSPSPGKRVRVDSLDSTYWAKRFAGAKRPEVIS